jgi:AhpD family alkylhydroperoxidase
MSKNYPELAQNITRLLGKFRQDQPNVMTGFQSLMTAASSKGSLDETTKELISLGIAVASRCDGCIAMHTQKLVKLGVTKEAYMETLSVAVYMGGGPSLMYAAEAIEAYEQFTK